MVQRFDPLRSETFLHLFAAVAEEMGATLRRSAFSVNVKERRDYSCALFDRRGRMFAQAAHLPVHLGSAPLSVRAALERFGADGFAPGDVVLLNDPFRGGSHLPDLTAVSPVFLPGDRVPSFFVSNRAHHADMGGTHPGSMGPSRDVHGEGLRIPPVRWVRAGVVDEGISEVFLANVRGPRERQGDLLAQWASLRLGADRLVALAREFGAAALKQRADDQWEWAAREARAFLLGWPKGRVQVEREVERGGPVLRARFEFRADRLRVDLSASDDQVDEPLNCPRSVAVSSLLYAMRLLGPASAPANEGWLEPVELVTRPGSIVDATYPAAVAAGNVETSQRLVDLLLGGFAALQPASVPAESGGTMSNLSFGLARADGGSSTYYETIGSGAGAGPTRAGAHALQTHMTNTRNTPIETFEREYPVRVLALSRRRGSGGAGARPGGDGIRKELLFLRPARLGWLATRQGAGAAGAAGGAPGKPGGLWVDGPSKAPSGPVGPSASLELDAGDRVVVETPGGGGHGQPAVGSRAPKGGRA